MVFWDLFHNESVYGPSGSRAFHPCALVARGLGFRVFGLGFTVQGLGFRMFDVGLEVPIESFSACRLQVNVFGGRAW